MTSQTLNSFDFIDYVHSFMTKREKLYIDFKKTFYIKKSQIKDMIDYSWELQMNVDNVLTHLRRNYKSIGFQDGVHYFAGTCITSASKSRVTFETSEPHKLITDLLYLSEFIDFDDEVEIYVECVRLQLSVKLLYKIWLQDKGIIVDAFIGNAEIPTYRKILGTKVAHARRKWCRLYMYRGLMSYEEFTYLMKNLNISSGLNKFPRLKPENKQIPDLIDII